MKENLKKQIFTYEMGLKPFYATSSQGGSMAHLYTNHNNFLF